MSNWQQRQRDTWNETADWERKNFSYEELLQLLDLIYGETAEMMDAGSIPECFMTKLVKVVVEGSERRGASSS